MTTKPNPTTFRYLSMDYKIHFGETDATPEGIHFYGQVKFENLSIHIRDTLAKNQQQWTMLHEILHIINSGAGGSMTEGHIDSTAAGLIEAFRQNPWLSDYIRKEK